MNAYHDDAGTKWVPAVKTTWGATINWHRSRDGRLRVDGGGRAVAAAVARMRRAFSKYIPGNTERGRRAGKQANRAAVQQGRAALEATRRRARNERLAGKVLVIRDRTLFRSDEAAQAGGQPGIWDILHECVGARNVPPHHVMPWTTFLRTGVTVTVSSDERGRCLAGKATVDAVDRG